MADELSMIVRGTLLRNFTGLGPTHIKKLMEEDNFPRPIKLTDAGRAKGFLMSDIRSWQEYRKAKTDGTTECETWLEYDLQQRAAQ